MAKILIVDDEARIILLLKSLLKANGFDVVSAQNGLDALEHMRAGDIDVAITDLRMTPMDGMTLFQELRKIDPHLPVILLTAYASVDNAIEAMKRGVFDYMTKPFKVDEMISTVKRAVEQAQNSEPDAATPADDTPHNCLFENVIASSPSMVHICEMMQKVAPTAATVLIYGESGCGKEVIARTLHEASPRKKKPWVAVNCAALPEPLLESEMFGHVKGAFTGAVSDKEGLFETANGGTLFLDEISSLPLLLQGKLLRVLQEREIRRVGGTKSIPVDVRVIAASNANLEKAIVDGTFRADLYYRLAVILLDLPPLRERKEDILPLARHFIQNECTLAGRPVPTLNQAASDVLLSYDWPGNVRELDNVVKHALTFLQGDIITPEILPSKIQTQATPPTPTISEKTSLKGYLREKEKEYLKHILSTTGGDKEKAAQALQVSIATLYRKISEDLPDSDSKSN